jgi:hypothetical protein
MVSEIMSPGRVVARIAETSSSLDTGVLFTASISESGWMPA